MTNLVIKSKYPQIIVRTFMVIDPMVNRAHHGGACSSSSLITDLEKFYKVRFTTTSASLTV